MVKLNNLKNKDVQYSPTYINQSNIVNSNIGSLNSNYTANTGLLVNFLIYKSTNLNYYIEHYIDLNSVLFELYNLPDIIINDEIDITNVNVLTKQYNIEKTAFNNTPILNNNIETLLTFDQKSIGKIISAIAKKDSFGNFPSLIIPLLSDHIRLILQSNFIKSYITYKVPILVPWGTLTPYVAYQKYLSDISGGSGIGSSDLSNSYIINMGPCHLDELSAYIQFVKSLKLYEQYKNDNKKFLEFSYNNSSLIGTNWLHKYDPYTADYNVDLSNVNIIYVGIDNSYGWYEPLEFFKLYSRTVTTYRFSNFVAEPDISNIYSNPDYSLDNSDNSYNLYNPNVTMINIPLFKSEDDCANLHVGKGVDKSLDLLHKVIVDGGLDLSNTHIFLRSYGKESDYVALNTLYKNYALYIPLMCGSFYDFLEENISKIATYESDVDALNGLLSIKSFDMANVNSYTLYKNKADIYTDRLSDTPVDSYYGSIDQNLFQYMNMNQLQMSLLINNAQKNIGIIADANTDTINYKIFTGEEIFSSSFKFDFNQLAASYGANKIGYLDNKLLFSGLIGCGYNNDTYWANNNGAPFNRHTFYTVFKRHLNYYDPLTLDSPKLDIGVNFHWMNYYKFFLFDGINGNPIYFSSEIDLINALIFKLNGDNTNYNTYYQKYKDNYDL